MAEDRQFISSQEAQKPFFVGIDVGGTNIKVGLVDDLGRPLAWNSIPTNSTAGAEDGAQRVGEAVREVARQAGIELKQITAAGLGTPGTMDIPAGMILEPPNLPGWSNFPIRDRVSHHCGLPVTFGNDAGVAAYGEYWVGSGRNFDSMVLFTLGTGIGCGIIVQDKNIEGEHSHGAECGHMIIDFNDDARECSCGQRGHLEAYASALSLVRRLQESLERGVATSIRERLRQGDKLSPLLLAQEAEKGDDFSREFIMETARYLGVGAANLMITIDPNGLVFGGNMTFGGHSTQLGRDFLDEIRAEIKRRAFPVPAKKTVIDFASLGGDAGYIGAAGLARLEAKG